MTTPYLSKSSFFGDLRSAEKSSSSVSYRLSCATVSAFSCRSEMSDGKSKSLASTKKNYMDDRNYCVMIVQTACHSRGHCSCAVVATCMSLSEFVNMRGQLTHAKHLSNDSVLEPKR
jgi:hypothetical protein